MNPFDAPPGKKKKAGTGKTAMRHALAICEDLWPGQPLITASRKTVWIVDKKGPCSQCGRGLVPITTAEDIFGVFDIALIGFGVPGFLIQVTTQTRDDRGGGQTVTARKRKIEAWLLETPVACDGRMGPRVEIWSWVARKYMRRFVCYTSLPALPQDPDAHLLGPRWEEQSALMSPEIKRNAAERIQGI